MAEVRSDVRPLPTSDEIPRSLSSAVARADPRRLTPDERGVLRDLVDRLGVALVARACRVASEPLTRALAGLEVRRGTIVAVRAGMALLLREDGADVEAGDQ
jgi:hypothetical protein